MSFLETSENDNVSTSLEIDPIKENRIPLQSLPDSKKPIILGFERKEGLAPVEDDDFVDTDEEIDKIRKEIKRLASRLDRLQSNRAERAKRGVVVARDSKKDGVFAADNRFGPREIVASGTKVLGPNKVGNSGARRRGVSLGPLEILGQIESGRIEKPKGTPFRAVKRVNNAKILGGIEEEDMSTLKFPPSIPSKSKGLLKTLENAKGLSNVRARMRGLSLGPSEIIRGNVGNQESKQKGARNDKGSRSLSVSPKPLAPFAAKASELRKGIATVGAQKIGRAEITMAMADLKPKALFEDGVKAFTGKKPLKSVKARVVPSRYSLAPSRVAGNEPGKNDGKLLTTETDREKKKEVVIDTSASMPDCVVDGEFEQKNHTVEDQEIPMDLEECSASLAPAHSTVQIAVVAPTLPRIKNLRCTIESPRDSGCVKRASQLVGRKFLFAAEEGEELPSMNQILEFEDEK